MAFLHYPDPVNHLPHFLCVFWRVRQATASICTDRGGYALWCRLPQKWAMRDTMKRHTLAHFAFFRFLSSPFQWRIWRQWESLTSTFNSLHQCHSRLCAWKRVNCWWMSFVCLLSFVFTTQIKCSECCVWFEWFTQWSCPSVSNLIACWCEEKWKEQSVDGCLLCVFFLLYSPLRSSTVSVVFDFNASLNDVAPVPPILLPVDVKRNEESNLLMDDIWVSSFFCLHHTDRDSWVLCWISMLHSMMLLLCLQSGCLLMWREMKRSNLLMDVFCVSSFVLTTQTEFSEYCVWFQCLTQWCCSCISNAVVFWGEENRERVIINT